MEPETPLIKRETEDGESLTPQELEPHSAAVKRENDVEDGEIIASCQQQKIEDRSPLVKQEHGDSAGRQRSQSQQPTLKRERERDGDHGDLDEVHKMQKTEPEALPVKVEHPPSDQEAVSKPSSKKHKNRRRRRSANTRRMGIHCFKFRHMWTHCWQYCSHRNSRFHAETYGVPSIRAAKRCPVLQGSLPAFYSVGRAQERMLRTIHQARLLDSMGGNEEGEEEDDDDEE